MSTDYISKRRSAYNKAGINPREIEELVVEYNLALSAGDTTTASKYKSILEEIHEKRQAIKQQFPKS